MALDAAYYIDSTFFSGFVRGKIFLHVETPWTKIFLGPYVNKIWNSLESETVLSVFVVF